MSEKMNTGENPQEEWTPDEEEELAEWFKTETQYAHIEIAKEKRRECAPEIAEFDAMIVSFESMYPLAELHSITELTREEAEMHPVREPARVALIPIFEKLKSLFEQTNISNNTYIELDEKYRILSRAVGMINKNIVDHDQ